MNTAVHTNDFAIDYSRGTDVKAAITRGQASTFLKRWLARYSAQRQAAAMAQIALYDPRLAEEIQAAQKRAV